MSYESERKLTNDDFRKLFMTPRHPGERVSAAANEAFATPSIPSKLDGSASVRKSQNKEKGEERRKRKHFYAKIKKEEDDQMAELALKYRDRAKERREGNEQKEELITAQGAYRAVAPDFRGNVDAAERRKQLIQESKFLGGDMEHTHLVKGLDYALLQKIKSEQETEGKEEDDAAPVDESSKEVVVTSTSSAVAVDQTEFHTKLARSINRVLFKNTLPERNELFAPGRMAYVIDLEEEYAESDIPTTLIRSKADVPNAEGQATLTTNDIVINKLAQILSYLRAGSKNAKRKKNKESKKPEEKESSSSSKRLEDDSIYGDIGDYKPSVEKTKSSRRDRDRERDRGEKEDRSASNKQSYFEKPADEEDREVVLDSSGVFATATGKNKRDKLSFGEDDKIPEQTFGSILKKDDKSLSRAQKLLSKMNAQPEGYAECYPGFDEMHDAIEDSDEETDFSKMDPGKKKGSVGRWDFDTVEEYSDYMSNKEALPKAAFQFGVKMNDGRKTRKATKTEKSEKAQLDRQWQQIQTMMQKRKASGLGEGPPEKTPRH